MKRIISAFLIIALATVVISGCKKKTKIKDDPEADQIALLTNSAWKATAVTLDGISDPYTTDFSGFILTLTEGKTYSTTGVPALYSSVWPASGSWDFKDTGAALPDLTIIVRSDGVEVSIIAITDTQFQLSFTYTTGSVNQGGRLNSTEGTYVFQMIPN